MVRAVVRVDGLNRLSGGVGSGEWGERGAQLSTSN